MNTPALPAYLQNRQSRIVSDGAADGIGGALPPHISIRGNVWTLVDANGNKQALSEILTNAQGQQQTVALPHLDGCFVDRSDHICKQYYEHDFEPDSADPPTCWSANGVAPSIEASKPQAARCDTCEWNIRGSDTSRLSGKAIKACRDEKWTAFIPVKYPGMIFQLKITPGSFKAWKGYVDKFKGQQTDLSDVVTRIQFETGKNGVMTFEAISYIDETLFKAREAAAIEKKTDALVGRNDRPIQAAIAAPRQEAGQSPLSVHAQPAGAAGATAPFQPTPAAGPAPFAGTPAGLPDSAGAGRRKRRTKAEIEAANAAQPATAGQASPAPAGFGGGGPAPFRPATPPEAGQAPGGASAPFGIATQAVAPDPAMKGMLDNIFGKSQ